MIKELQDTEEKYISALENGIADYVTAMSREDLPKCLRGKKHRIFGNIEAIYEFHKKKFNPKLLQCGDDVEKIANLFTNFITNDYFYLYITYGINRSQSEQICISNLDFWKVKFNFYLENLLFL